MKGIYNIEIKYVNDDLAVYLVKCMHHELKQSPFCHVPCSTEALATYYIQSFLSPQFPIILHQSPLSI